MANYIDPDTIDRINAAKKQLPNNKFKRNKSPTKEQILEENKQRILKMK